MSAVQVETCTSFSVSLDARRSRTIPRVMIDSSAFPHIMDEIVALADTDLLRSFRAVSKRFLTIVDQLTARHLVLDGEAASPWSPGAVLHNGLPGTRRRVLLRDSDKTPRTVLGIPAFRVLSEVQHTRTLDMRGTLRYEVLAGLPRFPHLHTLRMYEYYAAGPGAPDARKTLFWGASQREPKLPAAPRMVVFSSLALCPHAKFKPQLPRRYPLGVEELVIHFTLPTSDGEWAPLDLPPAPPASLERVTVILAPAPSSTLPGSFNSTATAVLANGSPALIERTNPGVGPRLTDNEEQNAYAVNRISGAGTNTPGRSSRQEPEFDTSAAQNMVADLAAVLERLSARATVVGGECLGKRLIANGLFAPLEDAGVQLLSAAEVRTAVGEGEWAVFTREAGSL